MSERRGRSRPLIAFFDSADVFEDVSRYYGVDQHWFATGWADKGTHAWLAVLQRDVGDVTWYAFSLKPTLQEATHALGFRVRMFRSSWLHRGLWRAFYLPRAAWRWQRYYRTFATVSSYVALATVAFLRALRKEPPDYIVLHDCTSGRFDVLLLLGWLVGARLVVLHGAAEPRAHLGRLLRRWTLRRAHRVIAADSAERDALITGFDVPRNRIAVILTPIDTDTFCPMDRTLACEAVRLDPCRRYIIFVGTLAHRKRVAALIRVFGSLAPRFPDVDLLIAGSGPELDALHRLAVVTHPTRIRLLGWIPTRERLCCLYNAAVCVALPFRGRGFPLVVGEAVSCGTPMVAPDVDGIRGLVIDGETGLLFRQGDEASFGAALARVLSDPTDAAAMRDRARRLALARMTAGAVAIDLRECFVETSPGF